MYYTHLGELPDLRENYAVFYIKDVEETEFSTPTTRRSSLSNRAKKEVPQEDMDEDEEEEESTPTFSRARSRRLAARRRSETEVNEDAEDERSEIEHEEVEDDEKTSNIDVSASGRPIRRVTRNRLNSSTGQDVINEVVSEDEEDIPIVRRTSARHSSNNKKPRGDEMSISSEPIMSTQDQGIRRSSRRISKPILKEAKDDSSSDSDDKNDENSGKFLN